MNVRKHGKAEVGGKDSVRLSVEHPHLYSQGDLSLQGSAPVLVPYSGKSKGILSVLRHSQLSPGKRRVLLSTESPSSALLSASASTLSNLFKFVF